MSQLFEISIYNRYTKKLEQEKVYGEAMVNLAYNSLFTKLIAPFIAGKALSQIYGKMQDAPRSRKKVPPFIRDFSIPIEDYQPGTLAASDIRHSYQSFNEFFIREFKPGKREFPATPESMGAFAEARYFGYENVNAATKIPVKGDFLSALGLLNNTEWAKTFAGGPLLLARLCPVDYHRYHYSDSGRTVDFYQIPGELHSVNPLALKHKPDIFVKNERRVSIVESEKFGMMAYVEVGATCVGKIVQSADESIAHQRGQEKGYFLFGGSTVIVLGEPGKWKPSADILENTAKGVETYVHLGDEVGLV